VPELLDVDVSTARSGKEDRRIDPRWHRVQRVEHDLPKRDGTNRSVGLPALFEDASGEAPANVEDVLLSVESRALESE
jgi:hypothetical protein